MTARLPDVSGDSADSADSAGRKGGTVWPGRSGRTGWTGVRGVRAVREWRGWQDARAAAGSSAAAASLRRVGAIVVKEFRHLRRDPRLVGIVLLMPLLQLLLFAYAISFDVRNVPTVVLDQDNSAASRSYVDAYRASGLFDVRGSVDSLAAVDDAFARGQATVAVVVPAGMAQELGRGQAAQVGVLVDGSEPNAARVGSSYATALNRSYGSQLRADWAQRQGLDTGSVGSVQPVLRTWYNPDRSSSIFLIPGLMVVVIMIVTVQQTAVTLVRERDQGTAEQLAVSPMRQVELMIGKLTPWTVLAFVDAFVIAVVGLGVFGLPLRGSVGFLVVATALFIVSALAIGLIVSALAPSLETANMIALLVSFLPAFLLSGFAFPLDSIPVVLQWLSYLMPGRYMVEISRGVFLKGAGFAELWPQLVSLGVYAVVLVVLASLIFRRRRA